MVSEGERGSESISPRAARGKIDQATLAVHVVRFLFCNVASVLGATQYTLTDPIVLNTCPLCPLLSRLMSGVIAVRRTRKIIVGLRTHSAASRLRVEQPAVHLEAAAQQVIVIAGVLAVLADAQVAEGAAA